MNEEIKNILNSGDRKKIRGLFSFTVDTTPELIEKKFITWSRYFFPKFFKSKDAPFHKEIDRGNIDVYLGNEPAFLDIAFRGAAKTLRTKIFIAFCIANDKEHHRRYIKVLSKDLGNAKQSTTDVYNMLVSRRIQSLYPEIFEKTDAKREETMSSFTTATGVKMVADSVGTDQRGDIQEDSRPDIIWFDDFETKLSLMSAPMTFKIWQNMEEAKNGLAKGGGRIYTCNYISERGNVHKLFEKIKCKINIPIWDENKVPTWDRFTTEEIEIIKNDADDFAGEYLGQPAVGLNIFFDRETLRRMEKKEPIKVISGFKIFHEFNPSHRYGVGADVSGGVGLDHSTTVFIDFTQVPNRVVATYKNNLIKPDIFGDEIERQCALFGNPIVAPEVNNHGHATIGRLKQIYSNIYERRGSPLKTEEIIIKEYGWLTNGATKPTMLFDLKKAIENGHLELSDPDLIHELESYTRDDLMDKDEDPRLTTRHFDLLMALAIAWQMRNYADTSETERRQKEDELRMKSEINLGERKADVGL